MSGERSQDGDVVPASSHTQRDTPPQVSPLLTMPMLDFAGRVRLGMGRMGAGASAGAQRQGGCRPSMPSA